MCRLRVIPHATFFALSYVSSHSLLSNDTVPLLQCVLCFPPQYHVMSFFFFWDPINGIWFTQSHLYQCLCKVGQLVINLKFILDGKGILNLLNFFFFYSWKSPGCLQKIFLLVFTSPQNSWFVYLARSHLYWASPFWHLRNVRAGQGGLEILTWNTYGLLALRRLRQCYKRAH